MNFNIKKIELVFWTVLPSAIAIFLFLLCITPKDVWGTNVIMPLFHLSVIFYWGRLQAPEMSYWFVFLLGLTMDVVIGTALGVSAVLYLIFLTLSNIQSKHTSKKPFIVIWGCFAGLLAIISILQWVFMSFSGHHPHAMAPAFLQFLMTACFYPLFHKLFDRLTGHIQRRRLIISRG